MLVRSSISILLGVLTTLSLHAASPVPDFNQQVYPVLTRHCLECHGPEKQKGKLRLDQPESFQVNASGQALVLPGNSKDSELLKRILSQDPEEMMPPKGSRVSKEDVA